MKHEKFIIIRKTKNQFHSFVLKPSKVPEATWKLGRTEVENLFS